GGQRREGDRLARVVAWLVDEPEELGREQRAQGHLDADRFEVRHELRDAEPAAGAFLGNRRQREHPNRFPICGHARLSPHARARTAAARSADSAATAATIGTTAWKPRPLDVPSGSRMSTVIAAAQTHRA